MNTRIKNHLTIGGLLVWAILLYVLLTTLARVAYASPVPVAEPPPVVDWSIIERYGWWGGALLFYGLAAYLLRRNEIEHWIARGRVLAYVTGAVGVLGSVLGWRFGADPEAIAAAVTGAVSLAVRPTVTPTTKPAGSASDGP